MVTNRVLEYLDERNTHYTVTEHRPTFTAQQTAEVIHVTGQQMAKPVMVWVDNKMTMVVVPAQFKINWDSLKEALNAYTIELAMEGDFRALFPDCEIGAMPPFGNLYGIDVIVEASLARDKNISFNAGTHNRSIRMAYKDFEEIVNPRVLKF